MLIALKMFSTALHEHNKEQTQKELFPLSQCSYLFVQRGIPFHGFCYQTVTRKTKICCFQTRKKTPTTTTNRITMINIIY
jgi:hypothetical protein